MFALILRLFFRLVGYDAGLGAGLRTPVGLRVQLEAHQVQLPRPRVRLRMRLKADILGGRGRGHEPETGRAGIEVLGGRILLVVPGLGPQHVPQEGDGRSSLQRVLVRMTEDKTSVIT